MSTYVEKFMVKLEEIYFKKGYTIDDNGVCYNSQGNPLKQFLTKNYLHISIRLSKDKTRIVKVHRLQAYKKYGDALYEPGIMVRHLDGNNVNNNISNIAIGTSKDNQLDMPKELRSKRSYNAGKKVNKYSKEFIQEIRNKHNNGYTYKQIMKEYHLAKSTISYIINHD